MYADAMRCRTSFTLALFLFATSAFAAPLTEVDDFGDNPGAISMYKYVPANVPANAPLVVALHGCRQDAEIYSKTGWVALAEEWQFTLVYPEQSLFNNPYRCWNWFQAEETARGQGEVQSIISMIDKMKNDHGIDASRIYVDGLSAGGWLTTILLASYPDVFAGGATHAGGPAFCAQTKHYFWDVFRWWNVYSASQNASRCMEGDDKSPQAWQELVEQFGFDGDDTQWPIISVWQGHADEVVDKLNQQEIIDQWTALHGADQVADNETQLGNNTNITLRQYANNNGKVVVESWSITSMKHGAAIFSGAVPPCGEASDYLLDAGVCSVRRIGQFWGLDSP